MFMAVLLPRLGIGIVLPINHELFNAFHTVGHSFHLLFQLMVAIYPQRSDWADRRAHHLPGYLCHIYQFYSLNPCSMVPFYYYTLFIILASTSAMLQKYVRSPNSEKYYNKMGVKQDQCFDLTLADMDIGVYQPLHHNVLANFQNMQTEIMKAKANLKSDEKIKQVERTYENQAENKIIDWYNQQYQCEIQLKTGNKNNFSSVNVLFCTSIVSLCSYSIMAFTKSNQAILVMAPVYYSYFLIVEKLKRRPVPTSLIYKKSNELSESEKTVFGYKVGNFFIDFQKMQKTIAEEKVRMLILSHPHNPSGRVWSQSDVKSIVRICKKYSVVIVSDEILSDLQLMNESRFYSLAKQFKIYSKIIIGNSISKAFNYSSIQGGYALTADSQLHQGMKRTMVDTFGESLDQLGVCAILGCLTNEGRIWLSIIREIMLSNYLKLVTFKECRAPLIEIALLEAAYLVYLDLGKYFSSAGEMKKIIESENVYVMQLGSNYLPEREKTLQVRICIACQQDHFNRFLIKFDKILKKAIQIKELPKL